MEFPGGRFATLGDPQGVAFGLPKMAPHQKNSTLRAGAVAGPPLHRKRRAKEPNACVVIDVEMVDTQAERSGWFDWLQQEKALVPEGSEDLVVDSVRVLHVNGRFLYLKGTTDLAEFNAGERRILEGLTRQGDTVFVAVGTDPSHLRLSYRMPDLDNAVAFDGDGLLALIRQWFVWASTQEN
jgi:hypothetical protein